MNSGRLHYNTNNKPKEKMNKPVSLRRTPVEGELADQFLPEKLGSRGQGSQIKSKACCRISASRTFCKSCHQSKGAKGRRTRSAWTRPLCKESARISRDSDDNYLLLPRCCALINLL